LLSQSGTDFEGQSHQTGSCIRTMNGFDPTIGPPHARALTLAAAQIKAHARLERGGIQPRTPCGYAKRGVVLYRFTPLLWLFNQSLDSWQPSMPYVLRVFYGLT